MKSLLVVLVAIMVGCSNPVNDEIRCVTGVLGDPDGLVLTEWSEVLLKFWQIEVPSPYILEVIVKKNYNEWVTAWWSLSDAFGIHLIFIYESSNVDSYSQYRIEYKK